MKKILSTIILLLMCSTLICSASYNTLLNEDNYEKFNLKRDLLVLMVAYEKEIVDIEKGDNENIYLILDNGKKVLYNGDLKSSLKTIYPLYSIDKVEEDSDPGRIRCYEFLGAIYGESRGSIEKNLKIFPTYYGDMYFNKNALAGESLKNALNEAGYASKDNPKISSYVTPISGTYNYRVIQDTGRLSPHSFGIAIDLQRDSRDYWKWASKDKGSERIASYSKELVKIFESHGFVWGGKWSHFDTLHFEYRPEIILKSKYFGEIKNDEVKNWYDGAPDDNKVKEKINLIESKNL
ncbi:M15 family metallopeptidase [Clostridium carnis]